MTRGDKGDFAQKHDPNTPIAPKLREELSKFEQNGTIACAVVFDIASRLGVSEQEIGMAVDLMNLKLVKCQLGLFGYGAAQKDSASKKPRDQISAAILSSRIDGRLPCAKAWQIAANHGVAKLALGNVCDALGVKIKPCQLGAF